MNITELRDGDLLELKGQIQVEIAKRFPDSPCCQDLVDWIKEAAPLLSTATCIVIDENIDRLDEIQGVRAVLEVCPIDFTDNAQAI